MHEMLHCAKLVFVRERAAADALKVNGDIDIHRLPSLIAEDWSTGVPLPACIALGGGS